MVTDSFCVVCTGQIPVFSWLVRKAFALEVQAARTQAEVDAQAAECTRRLEWLRGLDEKADKAGQDVAKIKGVLSSQGAQPKGR